MFMVAAMATGLASCCDEFKDPELTTYYTDADFRNEKLISIKEFKQLFYDVYGNGASSLAQTLEIKDDYVIRGKVISSDQAGNVYKSLYIYDEDSESAIELKLMTSNYVYYHVGQTIYVRTKGLAIGCYRYMLSVGVMPSAEDISNGYANSNIVTKPYVQAHIFKGELGELTAADTLVVNSSNYSTVLNDDALGRLVRFEGLTYKEGKYDSDVYPQYLETVYENGSSTATYTNKYYSTEGLTPTYAYSYNNDKYYGSSFWTYKPSETNSTSKVGNYIVRVSGYANFATQPLPESGSVNDVTAIYTKYSSKSGSYIKYQLLLNSLDCVQAVK
jgi:hypothetical protein